MAPPNPGDDDALEVFTDLSGKPDTTTSEDAGLLNQDLGKIDKDQIPDEDLEIDDEEADDAEEGDEAEGDEEEESEEEQGDGEESATDFDPKDVLLLVRDANNLDLREGQVKGIETQAKADIEAAKAAMKTAQEAGDTDANIAATEKYTNANIMLQNAGNALRSLETEKAGLTERAKVLYAKAPKDDEGKPILDGKRPAATAKDRAQAAEARPSKLVNKFKQANPWFGNAKYAKQSERLRAIDRGMAAEGGWDKDSPAYFEELGKRLNREHPGIYKNLDGKPVATGTRQRTGGAPIPGSSSAGGSRSGGGSAAAVKLTSQDLTMMSQFKLDPNNKDHRRQWLASKREQAEVNGRNA